MMRTLLAALSLSGAALLAAPALALDSDANQPINIAADRLDLDDRAGTAVYTGDVDMQQGSMKLTAQRVEIERNDQGEVTRVTATGDAERAYLEQRPAPDDPLVKGWGETIIYHAGERRVELVGQAELHQASDTFNGAYVEYFLDNRQVQARSQAQGSQNERVRMSLTPKSSEQ
ncbi:lipopolysaccharide transport periplasmic protein LptA [Modicisalibacter radicis]|uniref:lipopolysaccharide transport periplasmic protein LptA n=1 Tax=Halomonas sp. EAR18 TaxID=2518972 RepID=UPI00109C1095|nr:lipopolysaccharide transport periplasmic protein LptA [Halomonas sp. EAR18]